jgi:RNA recognition motif-containing protein
MIKLYVGNLPSSASEEAVRALFAEYGTVQTLSMVNDRQTGTPRGFGFVEMSTDDAAKAMEGLNGKDFDGRGAGPGPWRQHPQPPLELCCA